MEEVSAAFQYRSNAAGMRHRRSQPAMTPHWPNPEIFEIDRVEIAVEPWSWQFALAHRDEIDRHFACFQRKRSGVWNGRVLLLNRYAIRDGVLRGACFETDYANLCAWRDWNFPDPGVYNFFAAAALRAADGAYLVGEMAPSTAAAAQLYFPCGTPDPEDIGAGGLLDLAGSLARELREETGIDVATLDAAPGWCLVRDGGYLAVMKRLTAHQSAEELRAAIMRHLASESQPELSDIRVPRTDLAAMTSAASPAWAACGETSRRACAGEPSSATRGPVPYRLTRHLPRSATLGSEGR
jgi:8-oxo-dGTP pyrophosphatase MutT (NUDIX family)